MADKLIAGEELIWQGRPSWRSEMSFYAKWGVVALIPLIAIVLIDKFTSADWTPLYGGAFLVVVLALAVLIGFLRRYFTHYLISTRRITIRRGVLSKREQTAHIDRLQNVTIEQSVFDRLFRVGMVDFDTAGADADANLRFWGINDPHGLRDKIAVEYLGGDDPPHRGGVWGSDEPLVRAAAVAVVVAADCVLDPAVEAPQALVRDPSRTASPPAPAGTRGTRRRRRPAPPPTASTCRPGGGRSPRRRTRR